MRTKNPQDSRKRLLLVDDHPMSRHGIAGWIQNEPDLMVCAETESAEQALVAAQKSNPDLVLTDITLPGKNGIELVKDLRALLPDLPVLVVSMHDESLYAERALRAGARGYIMKDEGGDKLLQAVRRVLAGKIHLSHAISARIVENFSGRRPTTERAGISELSDREFEVFRLLGRGLSTGDIGRQLYLSPKTIDAHRANIKTKLRIKSSRELISFAARWDSLEKIPSETQESHGERTSLF